MGCPSNGRPRLAKVKVWIPIGLESGKIFSLLPLNLVHADEEQDIAQFFAFSSGV
jgi:hypothetical protein